MDRFDLRIYLSPPWPEDSYGESSVQARKSIEQVVTIQEDRHIGKDWFWNSDIPPSVIDDYCPIPPPLNSRWKELCQEHKLSGRGVDRVRRVARTIADLEGKEYPTADNFELALSLRADVL